MEIKKINLGITVAFLLFNFLLVEASLAGPADTVKKGLYKTGNEAGYAITDATTKTPKQTFEQAWATYISNFAIGVLAGFFMILVIYGGWLWMSAKGSEEQVERAKKLIIGATIGMAIIFSGRIIAELVITYLGQALPTK